MADRIYANGDRVQPVGCDWTAHGVVTDFKDGEYSVTWDDFVDGWHKPKHLAPEDGCTIHADCRENPASARGANEVANVRRHGSHDDQHTSEEGRLRALARVDRTSPPERGDRR